MFTPEDLPVGTVLVFRDHTDSYKYFRILRVYRKAVKYNIGVDWANVFIAMGESGAQEQLYGNDRPRQLVYEGEFVTDFEMAKSMDGPWDKAEHVCEVKNWHLNCDIFHTLIQEKTSRLNEVD